MKITNAKTSADHEELAAQYEKDAKDLQARAAEHKDMAKAYRKTGYLEGKLKLVTHCNRLAEKYEDAAKEDLAMAKIHHELAKKAK